MGKDNDRDSERQTGEFPGFDHITSYLVIELLVLFVFTV